MLQFEIRLTPRAPRFAPDSIGYDDENSPRREEKRASETIEVETKAAVKGEGERFEQHPVTLKKLLFDARLAVDRGGSRGRFIVRSLDEKSALIIQATWRRYRSLLEVWAEGGEYDQAQAAERIQSLFRGRVTRCELEHEQNCAIAIQRVFRGHMGRLRAGRARALVAKDVRELYEDFYAQVYIETCASQIARSWRRHRQRQDEAATRAQAVFRCYAVRRTVAVWSAAASVIQRLIRGVLGRQIFLKRLFRAHAATKVQAVYRMRAARKAYRDLLGFVVL